MEGYQKRLIAEYLELSDRIEKLAAFVANYDIGGIEYPTKKGLLESQLDTMKSYQYILQTRMMLEGLSEYL